MPLMLDSFERSKTRSSAASALESAQVPRVSIAACSAITPFGSMDQTWPALLAGKHIDDHARCLLPLSGDRATDLARRVALPILEAGLDRDAALIVGTSKGPVESWMAGGLEPTALAQVAAAFPQLRGPRLTYSAACASGLHALIRGAMMIQAGEVKQALILATESSLHPLFIASFQRLGVIPAESHGCRPFDLHRDGFLVSETASAVLLQADIGGEIEAPRSRVVVERFAMGGDATHLTGSDPDGKFLRRLLAQVIDDRSLDLVHAHGTGTHANDPVELAAIEASLPDTANPPLLYSHKGALGHSLGAAGLLSVVINCQCHVAGVVPPNPRLAHPLPARRVVLPHRPTRRQIHRSLAIAAGFGGATAVVSLLSL